MCACVCVSRPTWWPAERASLVRRLPLSGHRDRFWYPAGGTLRIPSSGRLGTVQRDALLLDDAESYNPVLRIHPGVDLDIETVEALRNADHLAKRIQEPHRNRVLGRVGA